MNNDRIIIAVSGLLDDVVEPIFHANTLEGHIKERMTEQGCDRANAALDWMEEHYNALFAAVFAMRVLIEGADV